MLNTNPSTSRMPCNSTVYTSELHVHLPVYYSVLIQHLPAWAWPLAPSPPPWHVPAQQQQKEPAQLAAGFQRVIPEQPQQTRDAYVVHVCVSCASALERLPRRGTMECQLRRAGIAVCTATAVIWFD